MASVAAGSVSLTTATPTAALTSLSKSQVTELSKNLDAPVEQFRSRPLECGHYRFMQADPLDRQGPGSVADHVAGAVGSCRQGGVIMLWLFCCW